MKSKFFNPLFFATVLFSSLIVTTAYGQTPGQIVISIPGIEYDDPNFTALREALKKNTKVKSVTPAYASGTASITCTYTSNATDLWDEVPKNSKLVFKLAEIDDNSIKLDYTKAKKNTSVATSKKDCFDCDYFPMCTYDLTKSYGGRIFHGIRNDDNSVDYYYCNNGEVIKRWDYTEAVTRTTVTSGQWDDWITTWKDYENKTASLTILRSNVPVGTTWTESISDEGFPYTFTLVAKGIKLIHEDKTYSDVIKVRLRDDYYYYAKNAGYVGKNLVDEQMKQRDIAGKSWQGVWKVTEENGKPVSPNETTEYLSIRETGKADLAYYVKKKSTGKLYWISWHTIPNYDAISEWTVSGNQAGSVLYLKFKYASGKSLDMGRQSVPQSKIIIGTKIYEYLGEKFDFNE